jgi:hypothetical protein
VPHLPHRHVPLPPPSKINAIALLSILNSVDHAILIPHLPFIVRVTLSEVELYLKQALSGAPRLITGTVENSPNLRFSSNVLSQRKENIRKEDGFDGVNLGELFRREIGTFLQRVGSSPQELASALEGDLGPRLLRLL